MVDYSTMNLVGKFYSQWTIAWVDSYSSYNLLEFYSASLPEIIKNLYLTCTFNFILETPLSFFFYVHTTFSSYF